MNAFSAPHHDSSSHGRHTSFFIEDILLGKSGSKTASSTMGHGIVRAPPALYASGMEAAAAAVGLYLHPQHSAAAYLHPATFQNPFLNHKSLHEHPFFSTATAAAAAAAAGKSHLKCLLWIFIISQFC